MLWPVLGGPYFQTWFLFQQHPLNVKKLYTWLFHPYRLLSAKMSECFACETLMVGTSVIFFFFSCSPALPPASLVSHFKPCSSRRKPVSMCGWQEWGENWMYGLRLQEMAVYVAPVVPRGLQSEALNSNVLTHYSLEQRTTENTGVQSTELVVSFTVYFWRNKLWILPQGLQSFTSQRDPWGDV